MKKDINKIPKNTIYCHGNITDSCPYWKSRKFYLIDMIWYFKRCLKELSLTSWFEIYGVKNKFQLFWALYKQEKKYGVYKCTYLKYKDTYQGESFLWDQCKECGIEEDEEEDL